MASEDIQIYLFNIIHLMHEYVHMLPSHAYIVNQEHPKFAIPPKL